MHCDFPVIDDFTHFSFFLSLRSGYPGIKSFILALVLVHSNMVRKTCSLVLLHFQKSDDGQSIGLMGVVNYTNFWKTPPAPLCPLFIHYSKTCVCFVMIRV